MINKHSGLREFGKFRLDTDRKLLWLGPEPVPLPLKAVDLLCVLVERSGEVVSKDEIWHEVWNDAFVEETNLTHNIYTLRKTFKDLGEPDLIKTVPRRGYRFTGSVREIPNAEMVLERHALTTTLIEIQDETRSESQPVEVGEDHLDHTVGFARRTVRMALVLSALTLVVGGFAIWRFEKASASISTPGFKSIAVLPLKSFASKNEEEELRLRITDALIARLSNTNDLAVRPTSAVLPFVNDDGNPIELGNKLRVDTVLDGRVQREGEMVRVTLQLLSVQTGKQIWSEQFSGQTNQILNLQDVISARVLSSLNNGEKPPTLSRPPTANTEAYEAYLKGRYFWSKRDEESLRKAIGFFEQAVALDPQFSEAYGGIADAQLLLYDQNIEVTPDIISQAKESLHHALLLKPDSADALATLGSVQMSYDWDWKGANTSLKHATEAAPNSPNAWVRYGVLLMRLRRFDESQAAFERAVMLDPLSLIANADLGMVHFCEKDFIGADAQLHKTLEIDDHSGLAHWLLSRSLWQQGRKAESVNEIERGLELDGNTELAKQIRSKTEAGSPEDGIAYLLYEWRNNPTKTNPHNLAYLSTYVGDREKALYWLQRSLDEHHPWTTWIAAIPEFDSLRNDPRFHEILHNVNLDEYAQ